VKNENSQLEQENVRLKLRIASLSLHKEMLQDARKIRILTIIDNSS